MAEQGKRTTKQPARRKEGNGNGEASPAAQDAARQLEPFLAGAAASQATTVEWVRAAAQVRAAVMVAKEFPRDPDEAMKDLRRACGQIEMARRAFYTYTRAGKTITGPTIQLAREAMRCWGNVDCGIWELDRQAGYSEMMAWAQDLQTNARFASTFRVVHYRERGADKGGSYLLEEDAVRDIYELNTNMGARRLREQIKAALPAWFMAIAEAACRKTMIELGDDDGLEEFGRRVEQCVQGFGSGRKFRPPVPQAALESKIGAPREAWTTHDLLTLRVLYEALARGELRVGAEFPSLAQGAAEGAEAVLDAAAKRQAAAAGDGEQESKGAPPADPPGAPSGPAGQAATTTGAGTAGAAAAGEEAQVRQVAVDAIGGLFRRARWAAHTKAHGQVRHGMIVRCLQGDPAAGEAPEEFDSVTLEGLTGDQVAAVLRRLSDFVSRSGEDEALHATMGQAALGNGGGEDQ